MNAIRSVGCIITGMALTACGSAPTSAPTYPNAALENTAQVVNRASGDSNVTKYAPNELRQAQDMLQRAQRAWTAKQDMAETGHLAYLAHQRAAIAIELGRQHAAEDSIKAASAERKQLQAQLQAQERTLQAQQVSQVESQAAAEQSAQKLVAEMKNLQAENSRRGMYITLPDTAFSDNPPQLRTNAIPLLDRLAAILKEHPERKVAVEGYTDSHGNEHRNLELSEERADQVRDALVSRGVAANRIIVRPLGENFPIASNGSSTGRQQNRRVEIILSDDDGKVPERRL